MLMIALLACRSPQEPAGDTADSAGLDTADTAPSDGITQDEFRELQWSITCDKSFECTDPETIDLAIEGGFWPFGADVEECYTLYDAAEHGADCDGDYDAVLAAECVDEYAAQTCGDWSSGLPWVCYSVCD